MSRTLLLVDDEPFNLELMTEILEEAGYEIQTAENGSDAWAMLEQSGCEFATVLLDKMMPGLNGFEVLQRIKSHEKLQFLPVIMQTAVGSANSIQEGLSFGAFYYLTKPFPRELLLAVVQAALSHWDRHMYFRELATQQIEALNYLQQARFQIRNHKEAQWITALLARACPHSERVATGLFELLINAIEHGNLGFNYQDKSQLQAEGRWETELSRRLINPAFSKKTVTIEFTQNEEAISFIITDQGQGFDWQGYLDAESRSYLDTHGRGILIAQKLSFDQLEYQGIGNQVQAKLWLIRPPKL